MHKGSTGTFYDTDQLPEKEFQMFDKGSEVPLRDLHLSQDLRKLHWKEEEKTSRRM